MAELDASTVPNPVLQDVVLMDYACNPPSQAETMRAPLICPDAGHPGLSAFEEGWAGQPAFAPIIVPVGKRGKQAQWWKSKKLVGALAGKVPKDRQVGRIAAIGFSEGCSGIRQLLSVPEDADQIDFVYACDGMHGDIDCQTNSILPASIEPWVQFALQAVQGKRMMVVTHSEVVPANRRCPPPSGYSGSVASTTETADALLAEVKRRIGFSEVAPRTIPYGLLGKEGFAPTPPDGASWSSWSNDAGRSVRVPGPWPVSRYVIHGNLIVVGFAAQGDDAPAASRQSAHVFQSWWVMRQVIREVLACRWAAKCETWNVNQHAQPTEPTSGLGRLPRMQLTTRYIDPRFPSVVQHPYMPNLRVLHRVVTALGEVSGGCLVEGKFARFSPESLQRIWSGDGLLSQYSTAELALISAGLAVGGIALHRRFARH